MLEKITESLINKIRKSMPDIDDERAEIINYGLQILLGEIPKFFILMIVAYLLGIFKLTLLTFFIMMPYKGFSGGLHFKTHTGCIISTCLYYCGIPLLSKYVILADVIKYIMIILTTIFGIIMIKLYAPADTEDVPILSKKIRKQKQMMSYVFFVIGLIVAAIINNVVISNIILFGYLLQTCMITKIAYKITKNRYGYEVYGSTSH